MKCSIGISNFLEISAAAAAAAAKSLSHVWLLATPWTAAYQAPLSMGFSRQDYWSGVPLLSPLRFLVFPILLFSSISLHWLLRKAFLSHLALLWSSAFKWVYLFFSPLVLASLLFTAICKVITLHYITLRPPQTVILLFCISFSWGWSWPLPPIQ